MHHNWSSMDLRLYDQYHPESIQPISNGVLRRSSGTAKHVIICIPLKKSKLFCENAVCLR